MLKLKSTNDSSMLGGKFETLWKPQRRWLIINWWWLCGSHWWWPCGSRRIYSSLQDLIPQIIGLVSRSGMQRDERLFLFSGSQEEKMTQGCENNNRGMYKVRTKAGPRDEQKKLESETILI